MKPRATGQRLRPLTAMLPLLLTVPVLAHTNGCPNRAFLGCVLALKEEKINFDRNIVRTVLSIESEARLLHTCRAYTKVLPCFRDRVLECGNQHQRELFGEVGRALMFLCSPFSAQRQRVLVEKQACMARVLSLPIAVGCKLPDKPYGKQVMQCKKECALATNNFSCSLKTWMSEQNACTLHDMAEHCGQEAADFYADFQASVFEPNYPFICHPTDKFVQKTQLSTRKPLRKPKQDLYHVSPRAEALSANSTFSPTTRLPPYLTSNKPTFDARVFTLATKAPSEMGKDEAGPQQHQRPKVSVPQVQQTFMDLVEKLLPLALQHNMTNLLQQQGRLMELSKQIDLRKMLAGNKKAQVIPVQQTTPTTTPATTTTTTLWNYYTTKVVQVHNPPVATGRPWRPWYFVSTEN